MSWIIKQMENLPAYLLPQLSKSQSGLSHAAISSSALRHSIYFNQIIIEELEYCPVHQKVASQGTHLCCELHPQSGHV